MSRVRNEPWSYGFLAGALVFLLGLLVSQAACCLQKQTRTAHVFESYERVVLIQATCLQPDMQVVAGFGTGVIVGPDRILTAAHMTMPGMMCAFEITAQDGKPRMVKPKVVLEDVDLASMVIASGEPFNVTSVLYGTKPLLGTTVCSTSAWPSLTRKCGEVLPYTKAKGGDLRMFIVVEPGNSGSGLYDEDGRLIGIVTARITGVNNQTMEGRAATLQAHLAELLK